MANCRLVLGVDHAAQDAAELRRVEARLLRLRDYARYAHPAFRCAIENEIRRLCDRRDTLVRLRRASLPRCYQVTRHDSEPTR